LCSVTVAGVHHHQYLHVQEYFKKAWGRQNEYPNIIGIQVGSKDRDEVIPAEMCIIAPDQRYTRNSASRIFVVDGDVFFQEPPGSPSTYQRWNQQPRHGRPVLGK
jgi:hypothetical protein